MTYYTQLHINIEDVPSEAISRFTYKPTRFDGTVGDVFITYRKSNATYIYEGVGLDEALTIVNEVAKVLDGEEHASVGFEVSCLKSSHKGEKVEAVAA